MERRRGSEYNFARNGVRSRGPKYSFVPMPPKFSGFGLASSLKKGAKPALAAFKDDETKRPPPGQQALAASEVRPPTRRMCRTATSLRTQMEIDDIPLDDMTVKQLKAFLTKQGTPAPPRLSSQWQGRDWLSAVRQIAVCNALGGWHVVRRHREIVRRLRRARALA